MIQKSADRHASLYINAHCVEPQKPQASICESFYAVALHELTHWTGHTSRLTRDFGERFGDETYAFEELIAELGASFVCADLGLAAVTLNDHARYIEGWFSVLRRDKKALFTAASQAAKAHDYLMTLATRSKDCFA